MFCGKCGNQIPEGVAFCGNCGAPVAQENPVNNQAQTENVNPEVVGNEAPVAETPVAKDYNNSAFATPDFNLPKKKKSGLLKKLIPAAVAVVLVFAIVLNFSAVSGFAIKTFGSSSAYLKHVETKALGNYSETVTDVYDNVILENIDFSSSSETDISLTVSDKITNLLGSEVDLDWLNGVVFSLDTNMKDDLQQIGLGLDISKKRILSLDMILNSVESEAFVAVSEFGEKYIRIPMSQIAGVKDVVDAEGSSGAGTKMYSDFAEEVMPESDVLDKLICKYAEIALENIVEVEKGSTTLKIKDIDQKLTVLEFVIDDRLLMNIAEDVLETAKEDKEIKKILNDFQDVAKEYNVFGSQDINIYEEFVKAVDEGLEELKGSNGETSNTEYANVCTYVNGDSEVVGRKLKVDGEEVFFYATVRKGNKFAFEATAANTASVIGTGTEKGDIINGVYEVVVNGKTYVEFEVEDFDTEKTKQGYLNGTFRVVPSSALIKDMFGSTAAAGLSLSDIAFEFKAETSDKKSEIAINIVDDKEVLVGINMKSESGKGKKINKPADKNVIDMNDTDALKQYVADIDLDKIIDNLKKTDIPSEYIDMIEQYVEYFQGMLG